MHKPRNLFESHESFFQDSLKAKNILEKITNQEIKGIDHHIYHLISLIIFLL